VRSSCALKPSSADCGTPLFDRIHREEGAMKKQIINYETMLKITKAMSMSKNPEEVISMTVKSIKSALDIKGCALFLVNPRINALELVASDGLSEEYLSKGPVSSLTSIAESLKDGPVAVYDVTDDPRIQYPEAAEKEGIASILSVPIHVKGEIIGNMRVYTSEPWEFTLEDVNFVQALGEISGIMIDMYRLHEGQNEIIDILTKMKESMPL
jgi:signal transduction protein with GAF and PtsI domain